MAENSRVEATGHDRSVAERRTRDRRTWRLAFFVSVAIHLLILVFGPRGTVTLPTESALGPNANSAEAAEGDVQVVSLTSAPPRAIARPAEPTIQVDVPIREILDVEPQPELTVDVPEPERPGVGSTVGQAPEDGDRAGLPDASGGGDAGDADSGRAGLIPPAPRGLIIPPTNRDLRGSEIQVWVFVDAEGRVVADSTRLEPPTGDRGFNERLVEEAAEWVFEPATENGRVVSAWFPYRISM